AGRADVRGGGAILRVGAAAFVGLRRSVGGDDAGRAAAGVRLLDADHDHAALDGFGRGDPAAGAGAGVRAFGPAAADPAAAALGAGGAERAAIPRADRRAVPDVHGPHPA